MTDVRVRFAPSPTGYLHIGGVRTALFNWLFARHHGGTFVLRIEDTDRDRSTDEAIDAILQGMRWTGLDWDEGPFRQTDRLDLYRGKAQELLQQGKAYWCVCTPEDLEARRKEAQAKGESIKYDGRCREKGIASPKEPAAMRFKSPQEGQTIVDDLIKGKIVFDNAVLDDLIILRSNNYPTYNFSVVIDDALMGITHVIRGDDHVNNTPRQVPMFEALGYQVPQFAHLPMILGSDKARLSKRHGATSVLAYRDMGYLPEALVNYLVRLGWSHGDQEIFTIQEMIEKFSLKHVQASAAVFNPEKLLWLNAEHIKQADPRHLAELLVPLLTQHGYDPNGPVQPQGGLVAVIPHVRERAKTLIEMADWVMPFVTEPVTMDEEAATKFLTPAITPSLKKFAERLSGLSSLSKEDVDPVIQSVLEEDGLKMGKFAQPLRVALTGRTFSPGIHEVMQLLGKDRTLARIEQVLQRKTS
ncbi:glutamate--tRNA ligase [Candidatus Nitronereus thalassa]|uniref:Glutamate--tRNA ligase n=1 Tax=Candidatus Nitronereus thalassa TaxID=3020898 RepID=A0ABU3K756_9BACT|nr:glutamate--tRNA ligase [Candidatus Nitronereus thalassa]MDT7042221.1 glutamate--tRNA ligase [Candidatus Nitronereus thalassa]